MSKPIDDPPPEKTLIAKAISGDRDALTALLQRHGPQLQERLRHEIGTRWHSLLDGEDVLQVTFLECFLKIGKFRDQGEGSFEAWLWQISRHNMLDAFRSLERAAGKPPQARRSYQNDVESSVALHEYIVATSGTPSRQVSAQETHHRVRQAVDQLPRDYSRVLTLYDLECRPIEEVSQIMGRTTGAVYMLRARALDYLRETLGSESQV